MRAAYDSVLYRIGKNNIKTSKGAVTFKKIRIQPNYLYIRFDPQNLKQEGRLKDKKKFVVIDYPFEYDNTEDYRKTKTFKEGELNSCWASVPISMKLPEHFLILFYKKCTCQKRMRKLIPKATREMQKLLEDK